MIFSIFSSIFSSQLFGKWKRMSNLPPAMFTCLCEFSVSFAITKKSAVFFSYFMEELQSQIERKQSVVREKGPGPLLITFSWTFRISTSQQAKVDSEYPFRRSLCWIHSKISKKLLKITKNHDFFIFAKIISRGRTDILRAGKCAQRSSKQITSWTAKR